MTKKDYILIAKAIKKQRSHEMTLYEDGGSNIEVVDAVAQALAYELQLENPRFDKQRFLIACGVVEN